MKRFGATALNASALRVARWLADRQIPAARCRISRDAARLDELPRATEHLVPIGAGVHAHGRRLRAAGGWETPPLRVGDLVVVPTRSVGAAARSASSPRRASDGAGGRRVISQFARAELRDGRLDATSRAALSALAERFVAPRLRRRGDVHGRLGATGGLVWRVDDLADDAITLSCVDAGGFLDENANTETDPWPPQAAGMYYADAFAAAVFARLAASDGAVWRERSRAAAEHVLRTYHRYAPAPIWYHHEFKNAPLVEALGLLGAPVPATLHGDTYEPTNVMAVRLHWLAARGSRARAGDERRIARARAVLLARQAANGLFCDDRPPLHEDVHDLSYHLFALGFLARFLAYRDDPELLQAFRRGCELVTNVQLRDGQIALCGRGTNNGYQTAAGIHALAFAERRFPGRGFLESAAAAWEYLSTWQQDDGWFPVACNDMPGHRMAWNHCSTPYNALTAYFLSHTAELLDDVPPPSSDRRNGSTGCHGTFARVARDGAELGFVTAYHGGYAWSGCHLPGVAGATGIALLDSPNLTLSPETLVAGEIEVTDLPRVLIAGAATDWRRQGEMRLREGGVLEYAVDRVRVRYEPDGASLLVHVEVDAAAADGVHAVARLPLLARHAGAIEATSDGFVVMGEDGDLRVSLDGGGARMPDAQPVPSNPRGRGLLVSWPLSLLQRSDGVLSGRYVLAWRPRRCSASEEADGTS